MVENFIKKRWQIDSHFLDGNCLWFAIILTIRFPELEIYYLPIQGHFIVGKDNISPIQGHFIVGKDNTYYDWTGKLKLEEKPILLDKLKKDDPLWYSHLMRDCFL